MNSSLEKKRLHEMEVFREFARAAQLPGDHNAAESRDSPEPDVFYPNPAQDSFFELGRLADAHFARGMLEVMREAPLPVTGGFSDVGYPQRDVLRRKLRKSYEAAGQPIQLVLYFDADAPHLAGPISPGAFEDEAAHVMVPILRQSMGPFSRIWYFERYRKTILWSYS